MAKNTCTASECDSPTVARRLCRKHYQRWWKRGNLELVPGYERRTLRERLDGKTLTGPDCWAWTGSHDPNGYGKIDVPLGANRRTMANAHRVAFEIYIGPIPAGFEVDHLCRNRGCVNPDHLEAVPKRVNILRGEGVAARCARRTHCVHGHEYTPENTRLGPAGNRICRECERIRSRRRWANDPQEMRRRERARVRSKRG